MTCCVLPSRKMLSPGVFLCCRRPLTMPLVDNFDAIVCQIVDGRSPESRGFPSFSSWCVFCSPILAYGTDGRKEKRNGKTGTPSQIDGAAQGYNSDTSGDSILRR